MCENRWKSGKFSQHGASLEHNVCIYIFVSYCSSRYQHFCCWNKNPTETFLCSCQDCFLPSQTESLLTSCPDIIFILWAFPFACCIFSEFFCLFTPHSFWLPQRGAYCYDAFNGKIIRKNCKKFHYCAKFELNFM